MSDTEPAGPSAAPATAGSRALVTVIAEAAHHGDPTNSRTFHLAKGRGDSDWQDVHCGGGIVYPGPREKVHAGEVCPQCVAAKRTASAGARSAEVGT